MKIHETMTTRMRFKLLWLIASAVAASAINVDPMQLVMPNEMVFPHGEEINQLMAAHDQHVGVAQAEARREDVDDDDVEEELRGRSPTSSQASNLTVEFLHLDEELINFDNLSHLSRVSGSFERDENVPTTPLKIPAAELPKRLDETRRSARNELSSRRIKQSKKFLRSKDSTLQMEAGQDQENEIEEDKDKDQDYIKDQTERRRRKAGRNPNDGMGVHAMFPNEVQAQLSSDRLYRSLDRLLKHREAQRDYQHEEESSFLKRKEKKP